jgi:hypothetical protein
MSLVRDSDAAARYAADPAKAIAEANLTDVTSADVNSLIPVVTESLSVGTPSAGADALSADADANVWASGAATAAFDAFGDHVPDPSFDHAQTLVTDVIDQPAAAVPSALDVSADAGASVDAGLDESLQLEALVVDEVPTDAGLGTDDWGQIPTDAQHVETEGSGFDIFD